MQHSISYKPLINRWEDFLAQGNSTDLKDFARYLLEEEEAAEKAVLEHGDTVHEYPYLTAEAGRAIFRLYKFSKIYSRPIMKKAGLTSFDEFSILATLLHTEELTKKDLIFENLVELTTGMDMLKRMLKGNLIQERKNPSDKREKLVSLSELGRKTLFAILEEFQTMEDVLGDLDRKEREETVKYLMELDKYHTAINTDRL